MKAQKLTAWFVAQPIRAAWLVFVPLLLILDLLFFEWPKELNDVLIEAHGVIFDLLVFGVVLAAYDHLRQKQQNVKRYQEEIDDFRGWDEKEAMYRIVGNFRRLNREGVSKIDLSYCYLSGARLNKVDLSGANLSGANLTRTNLSRANLTGADLSGANLSGADVTRAILAKVNISWANLSKAKLSNADLPMSDLTMSDLTSANLSNANLTGANLAMSTLTGANLSETNLTGADLTVANLTDANLSWANLRDADLNQALGLTFEILITCSSLYGTDGLPDDVKAKLKETKPELFENPDTSK